MHISIFSAQRLQREAIRRSLSRSQIVVDLYASSLAELPQVAAHASTRLCLLDAALLGLEEAISEFSRLGIAVAILTQGDAVDAVYRAVTTGSAKVLTPPSIDDSGELHGAQRFLLQLERMLQSVTAPPVAKTTVRANSLRVLAIGASTGGPGAIRSLLNALERPLAYAVLVVQHIDADYAQGFCEWLGSECQLPTQFAKGESYLQPGHVYVAPPARHMTMNACGQLVLNLGSSADAHIPAVEQLFASLAMQVKSGVAVLLTGMGEDGASSLRLLRDRGWQTFAQDAASAVVHGMPGAAIAQGGAAHVLNPAAIGKYISSNLMEAR